MTILETSYTYKSAKYKPRMAISNSTQLPPTTPQIGWKLTNIQKRAWEVRGHDGAESICYTKEILSIYYNGQIHHLEDCLYDPTYSNLISGQRINCQFSPINIEIDSFLGSISSKETKVFDVEIDGLGGIWIWGEWEGNIKKA